MTDPTHPRWLGLVALLLASLALVSAEGFYKSGPVLELTGKTFKRAVLDTQHLSIVEFYAPWCGHCQNLKPEYTRAARNLKGIANVAAINCDDQENRAVCNQYGVQGYPTLKFFGPKSSTNAEAAFLANFQGARTAAGVTDGVLDRVRGYAKVISSVPKFNEKYSQSPRVVLVAGKSHKSKASPPIFKSLSIDFHLAGDALGPVFGFVPYQHSKGALTAIGFDDADHDPKASVLVIYPFADDETPVFYDGPLKRDKIFAFLAEHLEIADSLDPKKRPSKRNIQKQAPKKKRAASPPSPASKKSPAAEPQGTDSKPVSPPANGGVTGADGAAVTGVPNGAGFDREKNGHHLYANRLFTTDDLRKKCFRTDSKPCVVAAIAVNLQIQGFRMFHAAEAKLDNTGQLPQGAKSVLWAHMIDTTEDDSGENEPAYMVSAFKLKPYFPTDWAVENRGEQLANLQKAGLGHMDPSPNWNHPPNCVYVNGKDGYFINFPPQTALDPTTIAQFVVDCNSGKYNDRKQNLPNGFFVSSANDEL